MVSALPRSKGLILAADADPAYARDLRQALMDVSEDPDDVLVVLNGQTVVDYLQQRGKRRPCVVLLDAWLPKVPGLDVLSWIRSRPELRAMPVALMSSGPDRTLLARAAALGANTFLLKPYGAPALARTMSAFAYYWRVLDFWCSPA